MTLAGRAKLLIDVVEVWQKMKPIVVEADPSNRIMRFAEGSIDYFSTVKRPALRP